MTAEEESLKSISAVNLSLSMSMLLLSPIILFLFSFLLFPPSLCVCVCVAYLLFSLSDICYAAAHCSVCVFVSFSEGDLLGCIDCDVRQRCWVYVAL